MSTATTQMLQKSLAHRRNPSELVAILPLPSEEEATPTVCEPEDVNPAWKRWSTALLKPDGLYGAKPTTGGNKAAKLNAIRASLKSADRVWLATDYNREG